jgi:hypothetical protein
MDRDVLIKALEATDGDFTNAALLTKRGRNFIRDRVIEYGLQDFVESLRNPAEPEWLARARAAMRRR